MGVGWGVVSWGGGRFLRILGHGTWSPMQGPHDDYFDDADEPPGEHESPAVWQEYSHHLQGELKRAFGRLYDPRWCKHCGASLCPWEQSNPRMERCLTTRDGGLHEG